MEGHFFALMTLLGLYFQLMAKWQNYSMIMTFQEKKVSVWTTGSKPKSPVSSVPGLTPLRPLVHLHVTFAPFLTWIFFLTI